MSDATHLMAPLLARSVDARVLLWIHRTFHGHGLDRAMLDITRLGTLPYILALTLVLAIAALRWRPHLVVPTLVGIAIAKLLSPVLKQLFRRPRPHLWHTLVHEASYSMPSGHATSAAAVGATAILLAWGSRWRWPVTIVSLAFALAVGVSRMYLGVHNPSDVLAGWALGAAVPGVSFALARRRRRPRPATP